MRYALLADIHGNLEALNAVMDQLSRERIDCYLCVGDVVGYGAEPAACLSRMQDANAVVVGGNHDLACVGKFDPKELNDAARAAVFWTRDQLSFTDLDYLRRLHLTEVFELFTLAHGTLKHPERFEYLIDMAQALETMKACSTLMCIVGHTHVSCFIEYDRSKHKIERVLERAQELTDVTFQDDAGSLRYVINPGSVGQPRDGNPMASFGVIDTTQRKLSIRRVHYDVASSQRKIRQAGLPAFLADRLAIGR